MGTGRSPFRGHITSNPSKPPGIRFFAVFGGMNFIRSPFWKSAWSEAPRPKAAAAWRLTEEEAHRESVTWELTLTHQPRNPSNRARWSVLAGFYSTENSEEPGIIGNYHGNQRVTNAFLEPARFSINVSAGANRPVAAEVGRRMLDRLVTTSATKWLGFATTRSRLDFVLLVPLLCQVIHFLLFTRPASARAISLTFSGRVFNTRPHFCNDFATNRKKQKTYRSVFVRFFCKKNAF